MSFQNNALCVKFIKVWVMVLFILITIHLFVSRYGYGDGYVQFDSVAEAIEIKPANGGVSPHSQYSSSDLPPPCPDKAIGEFNQQKKFTIIVPSYTPRHGELLDFLNHFGHLNCSILAEIIVVWSDKGDQKLNPIQDLPSTIKVPVRYITAPQGSLSERFRTPPNLETDAVLSIDDDIRMSCRSLGDMLYGFNLFPDRVVGISPRMHERNPDNNEMLYSWSKKSSEYSIILTNCAMFHRKWLDVYWSDEEKMVKMREVILEMYNGEDLAMNFLVPYYNGLKGPIEVRTRYDTIRPAVGISKGKDHQADRGLVLRKLSAIFGDDLLDKATSNLYMGP